MLGDLEWVQSRHRRALVVSGGYPSHVRRTCFVLKDQLTICWREGKQCHGPTPESDEPRHPTAPQPHILPSPKQCDTKDELTQHQVTCGISERIFRVTINQLQCSIKITYAVVRKFQLPKTSCWVVKYKQPCPFFFLVFQAILLLYYPCFLLP